MKFETDIRYYRELFRLREMRQRDKYDYFYGPYCEDRIMQQRINFNRMRRNKKKNILLEMRKNQLPRSRTASLDETNFDMFCCEEDLMVASDSDEPDATGVVRGNPHDHE